MAEEIISRIYIALHSHRGQHRHRAMQYQHECLRMSFRFARPFNTAAKRCAGKRYRLSVVCETDEDKGVLLSYLCVQRGAGWAIAGHLF